MTPSFAAGKISYLQIPAPDVRGSAAFYETVFGWNIRSHGEEVAFDDSVGEVSGHWVTDRLPSPPGMLIYVKVDNVDLALERIVEAGGEVVTPLTSQDEGEAFATFHDPAGNVFGIFHE